MKRITFVLLTICISAINVYSQKAKLQTANNYYRPPYQQYDKAKEAIDEVILHEQTKGMAKSWYTRGMIYEALYKNEKYGNLCDNCLVTAYESYQKAMDLEPNNEWVDEINKAKSRIAYFVFQEGVAAFQSKNYSKALSDFELVQKITPTDTAVVLNAAYSAERAGDLEKAKIYYSKLISMKFPDSNIYLNLSNIHKAQKDTAAALSAIMDGRAVYPDTISLLLAQINILLAGGKTEQAAQALNEATAKDPNNPNLYLALGSSYDNLANPRGADGKDLPKPKNYAELTMKAEDAYKKGIAISPNNYELNFNLGAMYFNQAAEMNNQANKLTDNNEYAKAKTKFEQKFRDAEPFLLKALDNNPKKTEDDMSIYQGTLNSLKQLYAKTGETEKYNKIKAQLDQKQ